MIAGIIDSVLKMLLPVVDWLVKKSTASNEAKKSFFEFVEATNRWRSGLANAGDAAQEQDSELDKLKRDK